LSRNADRHDVVVFVPPDGIEIFAVRSDDGDSDHLERYHTVNRCGNAHRMAAFLAFGR
jgi:hypothetical protein